jgi:hypothetical protein
VRTSIFLDHGALHAGNGVCGFCAHVLSRGGFHAPLPSLIIHLHGAAFSCWILLLVTQTWLVAAGRVDIHRRLGIAGFLLAALMVILGILAATDSLVREAGPAGRDPKFFYIIPLTDMLIFATLIFFAMRARSNPPAHKRFIFVGTTALLIAAPLAVRLRKPEAASGGAGLLRLPNYPGGLRFVVHAQGSSRHDMGRSLPDSRAADPSADWPDSRVALLRRLGSSLGPLGQIKIRRS